MGNATSSPLGCAAAPCTSSPTGNNNQSKTQNAHTSLDLSGGGGPASRSNNATSPSREPRQPTPATTTSASKSGTIALSGQKSSTALEREINQHALHAAELLSSIGSEELGGHEDAKSTTLPVLTHQGGVDSNQQEQRSPSYYPNAASSSTPTIFGINPSHARELFDTALERSPWFQATIIDPSSELETRRRRRVLFERCVPVKPNMNDVLYHVDRPASIFYVLLQGKLVLKSPGSIVLASVEILPPIVLGEEETLLCQRHAQTCICASADTVLMALHRLQLQSFMLTLRTAKNRLAPSGSSLSSTGLTLRSTQSTLQLLENDAESAIRLATRALQRFQLTNAEIKSLLPLMQEKTFPEGSTIIRAHTSCAGLYVIKSGQAIVTTEMVYNSMTTNQINNNSHNAALDVTKGGEQYTALLSGDCFGEGVLLNETKKPVQLGVNIMCSPDQPLVVLYFPPAALKSVVNAVVRLAFVVSLLMRSPYFASLDKREITAFAEASMYDSVHTYSPEQRIVQQGESYADGFHLIVCGFVAVHMMGGEATKEPTKSNTTTTSTTDSSSSVLLLTIGEHFGEQCMSVGAGRPTSSMRDVDNVQSETYQADMFACGHVITVFVSMDRLRRMDLFERVQRGFFEEQDGVELTHTTDFLSPNSAAELLARHASSSGGNIKRAPSLRKASRGASIRNFLSGGSSAEQHARNRRFSVEHLRSNRLLEFERILSMRDGAARSQRNVLLPAAGSGGNTTTTVKRQDFRIAASRLKCLHKLHSTPLAQVTLTLHVPSSQLMVLKALDIETAKSTGVAPYVLHEQEVLGSLHSFFIVNLISSWTEESTLYIALEPSLGGDLESLLHSHADHGRPNRGALGGFDTEFVRFVGASMILALKYLWEHGVVHRDVKPGNIVLDHHGNVKLVDFGVSKKLDPGSRFTSTLVGSPRYCAPELVARSLGRRDAYGGAVDWWALGVSLFELAVGHTPFEGTVANADGVAAVFGKVDAFRARMDGTPASAPTPAAAPTLESATNVNELIQSIDDGPQPANAPVRMERAISTGSARGLTPQERAQAILKDEIFAPFASSVARVNALPGQELPFSHLSMEEHVKYANLAGLIARLLDPDDLLRVGNGSTAVNGPREAMQCEVFQGLEWSRLARRTLKPPFVPTTFIVDPQKLTVADVEPPPVSRRKSLEGGSGSGSGGGGESNAGGDAPNVPTTPSSRPRLSRAIGSRLPSFSSRSATTTPLHQVGLSPTTNSSSTETDLENEMREKMEDGDEDIAQMKELKRRRGAMAREMSLKKMMMVQGMQTVDELRPQEDEDMVSNAFAEGGRAASNSITQTDNEVVVVVEDGGRPASSSSPPRRASPVSPIGGGNSTPPLHPPTTTNNQSPGSSSSRGGIMKRAPSAQFRKSQSLILQQSFSLEI